jgi:hypothetical protein
MPAETEVTEEQEQNTIARTLATAFYKEASVPSVQPMPQPSHAPIGSSIPTRIRVVPRRDQGQGSGGVPPIGQCHHGSWLADMTIDQRLHHNQLHPSMVTRTAPSYQRVGPPCPGLTVTLRDVPDMSREALSRVVASSLGSGLTGVAPVHVRSSVPPRRDRHEMKLPFDEHQRDEDDWLRGDSLKSKSETDNRSDTSDADHGSSAVHGSYNPMLWSGLGSSQLWGQYPMRAAMPVRIRPAVTVCAAPPPRCPVEQGDPESEGEAAARKVMSQLSLWRGKWSRLCRIGWLLLVLNWSVAVVHTTCHLTGWVIH